MSDSEKAKDPMKLRPEGCGAWGCFCLILIFGIYLGMFFSIFIYQAFPRNPRPFFYNGTAGYVGDRLRITTDFKDEMGNVFLLDEQYNAILFIPHNSPYIEIDFSFLQIGTTEDRVTIYDRKDLHAAIVDFKSTQNTMFVLEDIGEITTTQLPPNAASILERTIWNHSGMIKDVTIEIARIVKGEEGT